MTKSWYAVFTRTACEKKVAVQMAKRNVNYYLPFNYVVQKDADRHKLLYVPLFPSCVFVQTTEVDLINIKKLEGVISLLYWLNRPAIIKDREMTMMQQFLSEHKLVSASKILIGVKQKPGISRELMITGGEELIKWQGVRLVLPSLGYVLCAEDEFIRDETAERSEPQPLYIKSIDSLN